MLNILIIACIGLLGLSFLGYIFVILREKYYLKNNIVIIDNKSVSSQDFRDIDMTQMSYDGLVLKTGDEVKIVTEEKKTYKGILIGGKFKEGILKIVTFKDEIKELKVNKISNIKLLRAYGKFFNN